MSNITYTDLNETRRQAIEQAINWYRIGDGTASCQGLPYTISTKNEKQGYLTNCKNCGAPLHGHRCVYCSTQYVRF